MGLLKETTKDVAQEVIAILGSTALMSLMLWVVISIR